MISDSQFVELDAEIWDLIGLGGAVAPKSQGAAAEPADAALPEVVATPDAEDERRIDRIIEKARFEAVMKDSFSFLFKTMGEGATELTSGVIAAMNGEARSAGTAEPEGGFPDSDEEDEEETGADAPQP